MIACSQSRSVLHAVVREGEDITFARMLDEPDEAQRTVCLDADTWRDLGSPDVITVTIEPGDRLNED
jgi:hypothetical protein